MPGPYRTDRVVGARHASPVDISYFRSSVAPGATSDHCWNSSLRFFLTRTISSKLSSRVPTVAANSLNSSTVQMTPLARSAEKSPTIISASPASGGRGPRAPLPVVSSISHPSAISPKTLGETRASFPPRNGSSRAAKSTRHADRFASAR